MMRRLFLVAALLAPLASYAQTLIYTPPTAVPGVGTMTGVTAGEGISVGSGCGTGTISTTGTASANCLNINQQTGATYTTVSGDCGKVVQLSRATAVTLTLASAASNSGCMLHLSNIGAGNVTVATAVDGVSNRVIQQYGGFSIVSNGSAWVAASGVPATLGSNGQLDPDQQIPIASSSQTGVIRVDTAAGCMTLSGTNNRVLSVSQACRTAVISFIIDGGGSAITTGVKGDIEIPFACTNTAWRIFADQSGSIVVDIWKDNYANFPPTVADTIYGSKPTLSSATKAENTGQNVSISAGDILRYNVDSAATVQRVTVSLTCVKS